MSRQRPRTFQVSVSVPPVSENVELLVSGQETIAGYCHSDTFSFKSALPDGHRAKPLGRGPFTDFTEFSCNKPSGGGILRCGTVSWWPAALKLNL